MMQRVMTTLGKTMRTEFDDDDIAAMRRGPPAKTAPASAGAEEGGGRFDILDDIAADGAPVDAGEAAHDERASDVLGPWLVTWNDNRNATQSFEASSLEVARRRMLELGKDGAKIRLWRPQEFRLDITIID